jgi:OTU domain-containing protein 6
VQARKALKLDSFSKPRNDAEDARLELEARNEERDIKRICDQLGLDMYEVLSLPLFQYSAYSHTILILRSSPMAIVSLPLWLTNSPSTGLFPGKQHHMQ